MKIFTDGSVHAGSGLGCGAVLFVSHEAGTLVEFKPDYFQGNLQLCRFSQTNSTRLEFQVFLWAIERFFWIRDQQKGNDHILHQGESLEFYTDSQAIVLLPERRARLEDNNYCSKKGRPLANADLYKIFFACVDKFASTGMAYQIIKVEGHKPTKSKNQIDTLFALVDRAARNAVRQLNSDDLG